MFSFVLARCTRSFLWSNIERYAQIAVGFLFDDCYYCYACCWCNKTAKCLCDGKWMRSERERERKRHRWTGQSIDIVCQTHFVRYKRAWSCVSMISFRSIPFLITRSCCSRIKRLFLCAPMLPLLILLIFKHIRLAPCVVARYRLTSYSHFITEWTLQLAPWMVVARHFVFAIERCKPEDTDANMELLCPIHQLNPFDFCVRSQTFMGFD